LRVKKKKWDNDYSRVIRGYDIINTGRMINGGILTCNGTKCSASQDQPRKRRRKAIRMELDAAILARFEKTEKIPWWEDRTSHGRCIDVMKYSAREARMTVAEKVKMAVNGCKWLIKAPGAPLDADRFAT